MAFLSKQLTFTTTIMKNKVHLLLLIMIALTMAAQAQVTVSLTLRPPYSAYIKDYYHLENKAVIVLTNTTRLTQDIKLGGSISNQSRVFISVRHGLPAGFAHHTGAGRHTGTDGQRGPDALF
jgi:hypothetical protein